ncbi:hypothetical protein [Streptomyces axinellae]|uniref:Uncharacterized protein n=1 Tax=Streptomyces axinellae TaxID=552788 RepID=A0ABN3R0L2_9ACTN
MSVGVFDGPRPQATAEEAGPHVGGIAAHARETQRSAFVGACGDVLVLAAVAARLVAAGLITVSATATVLAAPFQGLYQPADGARRADDLGSAGTEQAIDQRDHCRGALGTLAGEQAGAVAELRGSLPPLVGVGQRVLDGRCGGPFIETGVELLQDPEDNLGAVLGRRVLLASGQAVLVVAEDLEGLSADRTRLAGLTS